MHEASTRPTSSTSALSDNNLFHPDRHSSDKTAWSCCWRFGLHRRLLFAKLGAHRDLEETERSQASFTGSLLAIRQASSNGHLSRPRPADRTAQPPSCDPGEGTAPRDPGHFIRVYCEAIRIALGLYFDLSHQLTHNASLWASLSRKGTSTLAGLAARSR